MDIVDTLTDRLRALMKEHRVKAAPLARAAKLNESAVRDILRGRSKNPGIVTLKKIASVLNLRPSALFEAGQAWKVIGLVVANGEISDADAAEEHDYAIENPFFAYRDEEFEAIAIQGESIAPLAFEGDFLIVSRRDFGVDENDVGRPCLCHLEDGRRLVRILRLGTEPNSYHLTPVSMFGAPEANVKLRSAARIALVLPQQMIPNLPEQTHEGGETLHEEGAKYSPRSTS
ncbi:MAG: helix-turn-helix transcriptional regulator [Neomegalonema sp.]|nr:helix-turn-helix transcriptional regulator [Neomegalonema sp.]